MVLEHEHEHEHERCHSKARCSASELRPALGSPAGARAAAAGAGDARHAACGMDSIDRHRVFNFGV